MGLSETFSYHKFMKFKIKSMIDTLIIPTDYIKM